MTTQSVLADRYSIERELGRGGMGAVYLARDLRLDRLVALKVLPAEFAADPALRERFVRETRTAASFSHPNIVPVHAVEERDGLVAYAMGYVEGESLAERVTRAGPLGVKDVVRILHDVGYALAYAHGRGVVHRDIKPDNIMIDRATGRALLMDFGISRAITARADSAPGLTRVGEVVGTPEYMSPEQASGDVVDGRSDLYSLGLVAFFAVSGRPAITGDTTQKILVRQLTEPLPPVVTVRPDLPQALAQAIDRCVAKQPDDRFATAEALVEALDAAHLHQPEIPVPIRIFAQELGTLSLVVVFTTIISWLFSRALSVRLAALDAVIPGIILSTVVLTRFLQTFAEGRRLALMGFPAPEVMRGLEAVVDERKAVREQLRLDPDTRRRRRITIALAVGQLVVGYVLLRLGLAMRVRISPTQFAVPLPVLGMVISALVMIVIGAVLLLRSPFRTPPGERLFRLVWLGPIGRGFVRLAARRANSATSSLAGRRSSVSNPRVVPANSGRSAVVPSPTAAHAVSAPLEHDRLATLESRVASLERWREGK